MRRLIVAQTIGRAVLAPAFLIALTGLSAAAVTRNAHSGSVIVHSALGGQILGYDVDQNGTEGIMSEALALDDGKNDVAVETFDQKTGKIVKIVREEKDTLNDFATYPVVGSGIGLVLYQDLGHNNIVRNDYKILDPLENNKFTGVWTPKFRKNELLWSVSEDQGQPITAIMTIENGGNAETSVLSTNVGANTFGPRVKLTDPIFDFDNSPVMAFDSATNTAVVASSNACRSCGTELALADLIHGTFTEFAGLGVGFVNGIAVDPADGIACTATEIDANVQFYNLATQTGFEVSMPNATSQEQSGTDVEYDPVNKLFLIGQPVSSTGGGSSVQVFDTNGNFIESINNLQLPVSPALLALNPNTRTGFVWEAPGGTALQSFTY
jgi:hypothetical protein